MPTQPKGSVRVSEGKQSEGRPARVVPAPPSQRSAKPVIVPAKYPPPPEPKIVPAKYQPVVDTPAAPAKATTIVETEPTIEVEPSPAKSPEPAGPPAKIPPVPDLRRIIATTTAAKSAPPSYEVDDTLPLLTASASVRSIDRSRNRILSTFYDLRLGPQEPTGPPPEPTEEPPSGSRRPPEPVAEESEDEHWGDWGPVGREPKSSSRAAPYRPRSPDP